MRRTAGQSEIPGNDIPDDRTAQGGKDERIIYAGGIDDAGTYGIGYMDTDKKDSGKLEECRPEDGIFRRKYPGRYNCRYCIGRIVEAVEKIKNQGYQNEKNNKSE